MAIGDFVLYDGRRYVLLGIDPMGVTDRRAEIQDPETGAVVRVPLDDVEPMREPRICTTFDAKRAELDSASRPSTMHEMDIYGVSFDLVGKQPIVLLKTKDGNKYLPIWIGQPEAAAILMKLQGASTPRPMTHDLLTEILSQLDAHVVRITVTELRENTFYAQVTVQMDGNEIEVDSRPSDAIALAIRAEAPIFAADDVIEESAIEFEGEDVNEEEMVAEFKRFLEDVSPEQFALGDEEQD